MLSALLDGNRVMLVLDEGEELVWRHHDPERLHRILELLRGSWWSTPRTMRCGSAPTGSTAPPEDDSWQDCPASAPSRRVQLNQ